MNVARTCGDLDTKESIVVVIFANSLALFNDVAVDTFFLSKSGLIPHMNTCFVSFDEVVFVVIAC